jgi:hypothetical protein
MQYVSQLSLSFAFATLGTFVYIGFVIFKKTLHDVNEKEIFSIFYHLLSVCAGVKIIFLSFNPNICADNNVDKGLLIVGGLMTIVASWKDIATKFKLITSSTS